MSPSATTSTPGFFIVVSPDGIVTFQIVFLSGNSPARPKNTSMNLEIVAGFSFAVLLHLCDVLGEVVRVVINAFFVL